MVRISLPAKTHGRSLPILLVSSWMWHLTRWGGLFLGAYLITHLGGRPIANQLVGVAMFAPMLLGSYFAGKVDMDPRRLVLFTEIVLLPISVLMTVLVGTGAVMPWMVYPFELAYGFGGMVNMTAQRELLFRIGGPQRATRVLNTELAGLASAQMLGPLIGGLTIAFFGLGAAFGVLAVLLACSAPLLWVSTRHLPAQARVIAPDDARRVGAKPDWQLLFRSRVLAVILLATLICNLCYFAFIPLVPVIAENLEAGPAMTGIIGSTAGIVQVVVAAAIVIRPARYPFAAYTFGVGLCMVCLAALAYAPTVPVALLTLGVAGIGQALFGATQATLPLSTVADHERATALGLVTTTIGLALPTGMVILGVTSNLLGARPAMLLSALVGLAAIAVTVLANQKLLRTPQRETPSGHATCVGGECNSIAAQPELG
ncbi:MAG: MFS transporter [Mycobacterium sp.]|nr:MFS transporter [Mycobacterium sp.]